MKTLGLALVLAAGLFFGLNSSANAQSSMEEVDMIQAAYGMDKKEMIAEFLQLDETNPFWAIYDDYETERKELGKRRIELIMDYAENYLDLSDEEIEAYMKDVMSLKAKTDKLIDTHYGKIRKASGAKVAAQFYEFEYYLLNAVRLTILDNIPFFGELDD